MFLNTISFTYSRLCIYSSNMCLCRYEFQSYPLFPAYVNIVIMKIHFILGLYLKNKPGCPNSLAL